MSTCVVAASPSVQSDPEYLLKTWETEDGLPENSATAMVQTADGYLWFGTFNGLVRFDGVKFTVFDPANTPQLPGAGIVNLHLDRTGRLWVSTYRGVAVLAGGKWRAIGIEDGWVGDYARSFAERSNGDLLITTFDGKVMEFAGGKLRELPSPPGEPGGGYFASVNGADQWCVAQHRFIGCWDGQQWTQTIPTPSVGADGVGSAAARDGGQWILIGQDLRKYRQGMEVSRQQLPDLPGGIWSLFEDSRGNVWICTMDKGLCQVTLTGELRRWTTANGLSYNGTRFVFEDRENNLWIGTSGGGLMRFKPRRFQVFGLESGLTERVVKSVWPAPGGGMWIATYGKGLFRLDEAGATNVPLPGWNGAGMYAQSVLTDRAGRTWVGTFGEGLWLSDTSAFQAIPFEQTGGDNISALFEDSRGRIWIGGAEQTACFDDGEFRVLVAEPRAAAAGARCFGEDGDGVVWLSNFDGVLRLVNDRFVEVLDEAQHPLRDITCLKADSTGAMWLGSLNDGLLRWRSGRLDRIGAAAGLPVRGIHSIIEDDAGFFWMSSSRGVVRAARNDLHAVADGVRPRLTCQLLDLDDGLPSVECPGGSQPTAARDAAGRLWFATLKGVAVIDPAEYRLNAVPPPTQIEELVYSTPSSQVSSGSGGRGAAVTPARLGAPFGGPVSLPAGSRQIEIHYTGLSFVAPAKVRFRVMLEGQDADWQDVENRRVSYYHDLGPGRYVFRVRAANNDGIWNESGASLAFTVQSFIWQTLWFRAGVAAMLIAGSAGSAWWLTRVRQRQRRHAEERFRLVVEAAPNAMIMVSAQGTITLVNAQAETDFGYSRKELDGQPIERLIPERFCAEHPGLRSDYFSQPTARAMGAGRELFGRRKDGSEFPVEIGLNPIRTNAGLFVLASIIDISERLRAELELVQQRNELAHLSRVTMLGELSGSLAHELNQPLMAILSNAQAAQRFMAHGKLDLDEVRDILSDIVEQDKRAGEVIRRLRLLLKKGEVHHQPLDLSEVVQDVLKLVRSDLINQGVTVQTELASDLPEVSGDRVQLQQVLLNLVMNACDALSDVASDDRRLVVRAESVDGEGVRVAVADRGCGIPPDSLERVFEPFFTTKTHGMGLGLAVCRTIITSHGGRLWAANNPDRGATIQFTVPVIDGGAA